MINLADGDELFFGGGFPTRPELRPDPVFCNIKLAVGRVLRACGAAGVVDLLFDAFEDSREGGSMTWFGEQAVNIELLDVALHQIAV